MGLLTKVGSITSPAATGNQATTGLGFQPKLLIFFGDNRTSDGMDGSTSTSTTMMMTVLGIAAGSTQNACLLDADDFGGGDPWVDQSNCIHLRGQTNATSDKVLATLVSFDADGFTLNFTTVNSGTVINYLALGGTDLTGVKLTTGLTIPTATGSASFTGAGFQPDAAIILAGHSGQTNTTQAGFGFVSGTTARGTATTNYNGFLSLYQRTDKAIAVVDGSGGGQFVSFEADLTSFDADGLTLNVTTAGTWVSGTKAMAILYLKGARFKAGAITQKTSTGTQATTGVGFQPSALLLGGAGKTAGTTIDGTSGINWHMGAASGTTARGAVTKVSNNFGVADLDRTKIYTHPSDASGGTPVLAAADLSSFDPDGFTLNYTAADATARQLLYLAIGPSSVSRLGAVTNIQNSADSGSQAVTVPANAKLAVLTIEGFIASSTRISGASVTLGGTAMTLQRTDIDTPSDGNQTGIFTLVNPPTGSQTLAWNWGGTAAWTDGGQMNVLFYDNVDTTTPVRGSYGGSPNTSGVGVANAKVAMAVTAVDGDGFVGVDYHFGGNPTTVTWTNATKLSESLFNGSYASLAEAVLAGNVTITDAADDTTATFITVTGIVIKKAGAGGNSWTQTVNDSVTMSDALAFARGLVLADSATLADTLAFGRTLNFSDSVTMSDAVSRGFGITVSDSVTLADALSVGYGLGLSDSVTVADALAIGYGLGLNDSVTMADALAFGYGLALADSVTMSDSISPVLNGGGTNWTQNINDSVTLADAVAFGYGLGLSDAATLADSISFGRGLALSDTVALADAVALGYGLGLSDNVTLADALAFDRGLSLDDIVTVADSVAFDRSLSIDDAVALSDALSMLFNGQPLTGAQSAHVRSYFISKFGFYT